MLCLLLAGMYQASLKCNSFNSPRKPAGSESLLHFMDASCPLRLNPPSQSSGKPFRMPHPDLSLPSLNCQQWWMRVLVSPSDWAGGSSSSCPRLWMNQGQIFPHSYLPGNQKTTFIQAGWSCGSDPSQDIPWKSPPPQPGG